MSKFAGLGLSVDTPSRMTLTHPVTGQPLRNRETGDEAWIELLSATGSVGRVHDRVVTDRQLKAPRGRRLTAEELEADTTEKLAKLTKGWSLVDLGGQPLAVEFTPANARELYGMPELAWLRDQVAEFSNSVGNFQPAASTS